MTKKQLIQAAVLNFTIVVADVLLFSNGFFHLLSQESIILKAVGVAALVMSILFFLYGNYCIFIKVQPTKLYKAEELKGSDDYLNALGECPNQKIFRGEIEKAARQIERMKKKAVLLQTILMQYFTEGEMAYSRFLNVIEGTEGVFFGNVKKVINRITIFDAEEYKEHAGDENVGRQHMDAIHQAIEQNDILLKKLDDLILEVSKLDDMRESALEELPAIQEIDQLIVETKYYQ